MHENYALETGSYNTDNFAETSFQDEENFDVLQHQIDLFAIEPEETLLLFPVCIHDIWQPYCCLIVATPMDGRLPLRGPPTVI